MFVETFLTFALIFLGSLIRILQISAFSEFDACASSTTVTGLSHRKQRGTLNSHQAAASDGSDNQSNIHLWPRSNGQK
jgi:hypothetical protein